MENQVSNLNNNVITDINGNSSVTEAVANSSISENSDVRWYRATVKMEVQKETKEGKLTKKYLIQAKSIEEAATIGLYTGETDDEVQYPVISVSLTKVELDGISKVVRLKEHKLGIASTQNTQN